MSVYQRGSVWWYDFRFRGVRYQERIGVSTRDAALQAEATRKSELASAHLAPRHKTRSPSFRAFAHGDFDRWCAIEHRDRTSTYARYMRSIKALCGFFGDRTLEAIDSGAVEQYKICRSQQKRRHAHDGRLVTPAAVNRDLAALRILFNYAIRLGKARQNPVVGVKFFRERQNHLRALTAEEESRYLAAASPLLRDIAILMLETGMRPGEIYRLRTEDVDLSLRSVHIRSGKTDTAVRHIPLTQRALDMICARVAAASTEWLFPSPFDCTKPVSDVIRSHLAAVARSGITPRFRLYDLRHTALSRMAMAGIDLPTLKELAGHSQIQLTMRYVHPTPEHKRRAMAKFAAFTNGR